ncbi:MAG: FAD/NAD(P)-binding oxidoreductase [Candidatus Omnitrophota bacterium]|nr:NAD(P)/FAD-dependent oxidoreductase [Candidatus Omnitrophota bacterium]
MKSITILGAGKSGLALAHALRAKGSQAPITIIDKNLYFLDKKEFISSFSFDTRIDRGTLAKDAGIAFVQATVERVNPSRKKIYRKEGEPCDYETLVVATGLAQVPATFKGDYREGFFYCARMDPFRVKEFLKISSEATVIAGTFLGLKLVLALQGSGKEVTVVGGSWDYLGDYRERIVEWLRQRGIIVYQNAIVEDVIGEGTVKAVKIAPLKVFSSQLVFLDGGYSAQCDFFEEPPVITDTFSCQYPDIYFLGDAARQGIADECFYAFNNKEAVACAQLLAEYIRGGPFPVFSHRVLTSFDKNALIEDFLNNPLARVAQE